MRGADPISAGGPGLRGARARRRNARNPLRACAARGHAGTVGGAVRRRGMPRRRGDRGHRRADRAPAAGRGGMSLQDDRVLALAGMAQALAQVRRIADTGQADATVLATALDSVFQIDADSPAAVYGGEQALRPGLLLLRDYFRNLSRDELLPRLALAVLQLERRFSRDPMAQRVHAG